MPEDNMNQAGSFFPQRVVHQANKNTSQKMGEKSSLEMHTLEGIDTLMVSEAMAVDGITYGKEVEQFLSAI